jgi:protein involved in polysaccharide export with SLBB domain
MVKVYQEEDLTTQVRIARDGSITLPLLGTLNVGSNTVEQAVGVVRDLLAKDYLVNPQVSLTVLEYAKRRFTVLGQVNRPGTYEMPSDDQISLLQAIAMAGGYTRIGNPKKVTVQRMVDGQTKVFKNLDAQAMAEEKKGKPFEVLPDDTITVGEKWI